MIKSFFYFFNTNVLLVTGKKAFNDLYSGSDETAGNIIKSVSSVIDILPLQLSLNSTFFPPVMPIIPLLPGTILSTYDGTSPLCKWPDITRSKLNSFPIVSFIFFNTCKYISLFEILLGVCCNKILYV